MKLEPSLNVVEGFVRRNAIEAKRALERVRGDTAYKRNKGGPGRAYARKQLAEAEAQFEKQHNVWVARGRPGGDLP